MILFEPITEETLELALEIVNSNPAYNSLENGHPLRALQEVSEDFLNPATESFLVSDDNKLIGVIDFLKNNPNDNFPWIGLLMIHGDYHSLGYGRDVYVDFEEKLKQQGFKQIRLGVLKQNDKAKRFWESLGFQFYRENQWEGKDIDCFEKQLD